VSESGDRLALGIPGAVASAFSGSSRGCAGPLPLRVELLVCFRPHGLS